MADAVNWTADDLYRRMSFGLKCAYAHGPQAMRTHCDAFGDMAKTVFAVAAQLQQDWANRMTLQTVCLVSLDYYLTAEGEALADLVADAGGILGGVAYASADLDRQLDRLFTLAAERNLAIDLHVDESLTPTDQGLRHIAQTKLRHNFSAPVICGHCCSLSVQSEADVAATLALVKAAAIGVVSLPMCNLFLQGRQPHRTPRYRGVTLLHELQAQGIPVAISSDNCRDPFYAYGDHDGLDVFKQSVRIGHLDRPFDHWPQSMTRRPAQLMGLENIGFLSPGSSADMICFQARSLNELIARAQENRVVLRQGKQIDTTLPDYSELDVWL